MKRERLTCNDLDLRVVCDYVRKAPYTGASLSRMADHFGLEQQELFEWLKLHGFRTTVKDVTLTLVLRK